MRTRALLTQVLVANLVVDLARGRRRGLLAGSDDLDLASALVILAVAIAATVVFNALLLTRRFAPLERLIEAMERADLSRPGTNLGAATDGRAETEEVARLEVAFRRMLERLEAERRRSASAALEAQEDERARVARDLHDEVNQSLTGSCCISRRRARARPELIPELTETKALANRAMDELLAVASQLRPTALDDLGLEAALTAHVEDLERRTGIRSSFEADGDIRELQPEVQLVLYRVAQEALSNAARHSGADRIGVRAPRRRARGADRARRRTWVLVRRGGRRARDPRDARAGAARRRRAGNRVATDGHDREARGVVVA